MVCFICMYDLLHFVSNDLNCLMLGLFEQFAGTCRADCNCRHAESRVRLLSFFFRSVIGPLVSIGGIASCSHPSKEDPTSFSYSPLIFPPCKCVKYISVIRFVDACNFLCVLGPIQHRLEKVCVRKLIGLYQMRTADTRTNTQLCGVQPGRIWFRRLDSENEQV